MYSKNERMSTIEVLKSQDRDYQAYIICHFSGKLDSHLIILIICNTFVIPMDFVIAQTENDEISWNMYPHNTRSDRETVYRQ